MTAAMPTLHIDGIALWAPPLPGWDVARAALRGAAGTTAAALPRPAPALLAPNERRRAPDTVLLALEVASAAVAASGHDAHDLASVFMSAHGDLPITDALCRTLAQDPLLLSPTRFHHSVHNAASGYWAIASGSRAASTALSAQAAHGFGAALLEAACLCMADARPVLLVACDTQACGALASVNRSRGLLALALVLSPWQGPASRWALDWALQPGAARLPALRSAAALALADNASAAGLPLFEALAGDEPARLALPAGDALALQIALNPLPPP